MPNFGQRILLLVPHPDDEIVGFCAAIGRARAAGAEVFALYLTHGCLARETMWPWQRGGYEAMIARRRAEAERVAAFLCLTPVGWNSRPARHLWRALPEVLAECRAAIAAHAIDQVWLPAYEGGNPDHDGLNAVGQILRQQVEVLEFAEYHFAGGRVHSQSFVAPNGSETILTLTPAEQQTKCAALALYESERMNLNYVATAQESFRPLAPYDYSDSPHAGTLWYARFQWVPFRHPRVDFTNPSEVAEAIIRFLRIAGK